jgi:hypothetical protein
VSDSRLDLLELDRSYLDTLKEIETEGIRFVSANFVKNISQIDSLIGMPTLLFYLGSVRGQNHVLAYQETTGNTISPFRWPQPSEAEHQRIAACERTLTFAVFDQFKDEARKAAVMKDTYQEIINSSPLIAESFAGSVKTILSAVLTGTWSAFETLAGDLWEESLKIHPRGLSELNGKPGDELKAKQKAARLPGQQDLRVDQKQEMMVPLSTLGKHGFNVSDQMGAILRGRFNFSKLEGIREAYIRAFGNDNFGKPILEHLGNDCLDSISEVRHLIVHKSGKVDEKFVAALKEDSRFASLKEKDDIFLDGPLVKSLIDPAIACASKLCKSVDNWIIHN